MPCVCVTSDLRRSRFNIIILDSIRSGRDTYDAVRERRWGDAVFNASGFICDVAKGCKFLSKVPGVDKLGGWARRRVTEASPSTSSIKNTSGTIDEMATSARTQPYRPDTVSTHARSRMESRHITYESTQEAVSRGTRTFDPVTGTARYDLPTSASSTGRAVTVIRNEVTGNLITVIDRGS